MPELSTTAAVVDQVLAPTIWDLEEEFGVELPTLVHVYSGSLKGPGILVGHRVPGLEEKHAVGEIRMRFSRTYNESRHLYFAQALYPKSVSPDTGFSGFKVDGDVKIAVGEHPLVRSMGLTVLFNVWHWLRWC